MLHTKLRAVFAGAGLAMMGEPSVVSTVLSLTGKQDAHDVKMLYLGTATYDLPQFREKQTAAFSERGVTVTSLDVALTVPSEDHVAAAIDGADVILVSGGCTLFAVDRWRRAKMVEPLRRAMERGATLCGGSAGAGCWFDALHSDSMDPDWYRETMLAGRGAAAAQKPAGEAAAHQKRTASDGPPPWEYIRVPGLGFLPGLLCPHHDRTQSNGVLRSDDFAAMLARHPGETGLAIDHYAALVIEDGRYRTLALPGKPGSRTPSGANEPGKGTPAVWLKRIAGSGGQQQLEERALPEAGGPLEEVFVPAVDIVEDPRVAIARVENPADDLRVQ
jgi:dipeptidase E